MNPQELIQQVSNGLSLGSTYALLALGLAQVQREKRFNRMLKRIAEQRPIRADKPLSAEIVCPMRAICCELCKEILQRDAARIQSMCV